MKKKWWIILICIIILTTLIGWYYYSYNKCKSYKDDCSKLCDFKSVIMGRYNCAPIGYYNGDWESSNCKCHGDECLCSNITRGNNEIESDEPEIKNVENK